jgi:hypothetical protein
MKPIRASLGFSLVIAIFISADPAFAGYGIGGKNLSGDRSALPFLWL